MLSYCRKRRMTMKKAQESSLSTRIEPYKESRRTVILFLEVSLITSHSSQHGEKAHKISHASLTPWPHNFGQPGSVRRLIDTAPILVHSQNLSPRKQKHQLPRPRPRPLPRNRRQASQQPKARPRAKRKPKLLRLPKPRTRRAPPSKARKRSSMHGRPEPRRG